LSRTIILRYLCISFVVLLHLHFLQKKSISHSYNHKPVTDLVIYKK